MRSYSVPFRMGFSRASMALVCLLQSIPAEANVPLSLAVVALTPPPNYMPTTDAEDKLQLTDGRFNRFPFWASRESVGWIRNTPVTIEASANFVNGVPYELILRSARRASAGVEPPRRVDIYCGPSSSSAWLHAGGLAHDRRNSVDGSVVDLAVPFIGCDGNRMLAVIHADGAFIMLDELTLLRKNGGSQGDVATSADVRTLRGIPEIPGNTDPKADSTNRLEEGLMRAARQKLAMLLRSFNADHSEAWLSEAWQQLPEAATPKTLAVSTLISSGVRYIVGVANPTSTTRRYTLYLDPWSSARTTVRSLQPILAADGQLVFDPLVAARIANHEVPPGGITYYFVTEAAGTLGGQRTLRVTDDTGWEQTLIVNISAYELIQPTKLDSPRVLVWTYTRDQPIWSPDNEKATVARLVDAGVNVFEIHPSDLPQPFSAHEWDHRVEMLRRHLALYRGHGLILLFLGGAVWKDLAAASDDPTSRRLLASWLALLQKTFGDAGYKESDWALYLKDEPRGEELAQLAKAIDTLRAIQPALQFYANPTSGRALESSSVSKLSVLRGRVKFLQPLVGDAFDRTRKMLADDKFSELWLYVVPSAPARSALPACFRELGRLAFDKGASGLGFWSLSDTFQSSAWSDLDGMRPDWAVVYEGGNGFVPGRRWEAFVQGVADYKGLRYCQRASFGNPALTDQCQRYRTALEAGRPTCRGWW